ncbi:hypothetical protein BDV24DRAFT_163437 [Aspergillus arachidicola]|uniref:Uncharacterized protein n=1 Tax=Aspergillus arachidicola TaxID=656916 RepID=A0A5N6Y753_9EURO|nr:hypothetical protein BDV24DRAFT_163437 [Aspergillus arachidicola]
MPFTLEPAHLWMAVVIILTWNLGNHQNPVIKVFNDWLGARLQLLLEALWPLPEGGSRRPDQITREELKEMLREVLREVDVERQERVGEEREVVAEEVAEQVAEENVGDEPERVGERREEVVRSDSSGKGSPANSRNIFHRLLGAQRLWRAPRRRGDLESGLFYRGRSRTPRPAARQPLTQALQPDARGGPAAGDLNVLTTSLLPSLVGDPTSGQP